MTDPIDEFDDLPDDAPLPGTDQPATPDPGNAPIREDDPTVIEQPTTEEREP